MKITPIEIRQHTFEKSMRGYRPDEVDAFLASLSQEWERVVGDQKMLKMQLELAEKELNKLREVEMTLFRTLKTAEDTSSQITEQARVAGEQHLGEARQKADDILADARKRSALMVQDSENQARYIKDNIINDLKSTEHDLKALERYKDNLVTQIRTLAVNANESVDRFEVKFARQSIQSKIDEVTAEVGESQSAVPTPEPTTRAAQQVEVVAAELPADAEVPTDTPTILETTTNAETAEPAPEAHSERVIPATEADLPGSAMANADSPEELPPLTDEDDELPTVANVSGSAMAGANSTATHQDAHSGKPNGQSVAPKPTVETDEKKEGGSFFDQI